ncbi:rab GTPase-activating protein 1-like isoform X1 [Tachysurus ichikawai]
MYASQWFLTLFTAKFPLYMVFHIIDLLLCEGISVIFNVALALLKTSKDDLLQSDFEGALKFFRVPVPKRYRSEENAKKLMELACSMKCYGTASRGHCGVTIEISLFNECL